MKNKKRNATKRYNLNYGIRSKEVRVIDENGNLGVMETKKAIELALERGLDLIEISPNAEPPVAKIMDWGKFQYQEKKKMKEAKSRSKTQETKVVQIKPATDKGGMKLKSDRALKYLKNGDRVKLELYLSGRYKYLDKEFLMGKIQAFLDLLEFPYKIVEEAKKVPKGYALLLEPDSKRVKDELKDKQIVEQEDKGDKEGDSQD